MNQNDETKILLEALKYFYPGYFGEDLHPTRAFFEHEGEKYSKDWVLLETFRISQVPEKTSDIGVAIRELERISTSIVVEPPKSPVESTIPQAGLRAAQEMHAEMVAAQKTEIKERVGIQTQSDIDSKLKAAKNAEVIRKFQKAAKDKVVYAEIKEAKENKLSPEQEKVLSKLQEASIKDPEGLTKQVVAEIQTKLREICVPGATDQEIADVAQLTADNMVGACSGTSPILGAMVFKKSSNSKVLRGLMGDAATTKVLTDYSERQIAGFMASKTITGKIFGEEFSEIVFKIPEAVRILDLPNANTTPFEVSKILNVESSVPVFVQGINTSTAIETVVKQPIFIRQVVRPSPTTQITKVDTEKYDFKASMDVFRPKEVKPSLEIKNIIKEPLKIAISGAPLRAIASRFTKVFADLASWAKIQTKGLEKSQGILVIGGAVLGIVGLATGSLITASAGFTSSAMGFAINPGAIFTGSAFTSMIAPIIALFESILGSFLTGIVLPIILATLSVPLIVAIFLFIINSGAYIVPPTPIGSSIIHIPPGGNLTKCDPQKTGKDITEELASSIINGSVNLLPNSVLSRQEGLCITPTMIILHTSGGYDNDDGNARTYETLVLSNNTPYPASCQMATDTNDTILMLNFFEKQVENAWCADNLNAGGVSIEMAGECQGGGCAQVAKCSPDTNLTYTPDGPHPCAPLEDLSFDAICKVMQKYSIPWTQVFQHEASNGTHTDPVGDAWVDKFILRLKNNCQI